MAIFGANHLGRRFLQIGRPNDKAGANDTVYYILKDVTTDFYHILYNFFTWNKTILLNLMQGMCENFAILNFNKLIEFFQVNIQYFRCVDQVFGYLWLNCMSSWTQLIIFVKNWTTDVATMSCQSSDIPIGRPFIFTKAHSDFQRSFSRFSYTFTNN